MAAKTEVKDDEDVDAMWMVDAKMNVSSWLADFSDEQFEHWEESESAGEREKDWISDNKDDDKYCAGPSYHANHVVGDSMLDLILNCTFKILIESDTSESKVFKIFETDVFKLLNQLQDTLTKIWISYQIQNLSQTLSVN